MPTRQHRTGPVVVIGGHEDKTGDRVILRALARCVGSGTLAVFTVASNLPDELWDEYHRVFRSLGVRHLRHVNIASRADALAGRGADILTEAAGAFFTGGDQLRITSQLGDTPVFDALHALHARGGMIAGTSAGASVMCDTMLVSGESDASPRVGEEVRMAPGLNFLRDMVVDQHFAERGRVGRLVGAVALNPRVLGVGIDENTAVVVEGKQMRVLGTGAVYVADGSAVEYSNVAEESTGRAISIYNLRLHVLTQGDTFDLAERVPRPHPAEVVEEELLGAK